jgi:hypothetical protein
MLRANNSFLKTVPCVAKYLPYICTVQRPVLWLGTSFRFFYLILFFTMKPSFSSAQSLVGTASSVTRMATPAPYLRALVLGGLAMLGSVGTACAQNISSVEAKQGDAQALYLTIDNPALQRMQVQVVSLDNHAQIINEVNYKASYGVKLHFKGLSAGPYAVLLRVGRERYRYNVQVADQTQTTISVSGEMLAKPLAAVTTR